MSNQRPTFEVYPSGPVDYSTAEDAIELAGVAGVSLLDWQADQVRRILGQRDDGQWAASRHGLTVARQNGKGVILEVVTLAATVLLGERVLWTAHEVRTMLESFARFRALLDATPALRAKVTAMRTANGHERIEFANGAMVRFSARSKSATRGLGFRRIIADEAQEFDYLAMSAMLPTLSGQGAAATQLILAGTPPYSKAGEVFTDTRAAAYEAGDTRLSWSEWACEPNDRTDDERVWTRTNPSEGVIVMHSKIADEHNTLASRPEVFRRERLGEWGRSGETQLALEPTAWAAGASARASWPARDDRYTMSRKPWVFFGIDATYDRDFAALVEARPLADGSTALIVQDVGEGLNWIAPALDGIRDKAWPVVVFDPARVGDLTHDLNAAGIPERRGRHRHIAPATARDLMTGCDALVRLTSEHTLRHDDPRLDAAAACATRSTYADGRGWKLTATDGGNIAPLIAGALALQALRAFEPRNTRSNRAVFA